MVDGPLHCYVHPKRETALRCNRCDRPICTDCLVQTPVGGRCRACASPAVARLHAVPLARQARAAAAGFLTAIVLGTLFANFVRGIFFGLWLGLFYGWIVAMVIDRVAGHKHGTYLPIAGGAAIVAGAVAGQVLNPLLLGLPLTAALNIVAFILRDGLGFGIFVLLAVVLAVSRLR
ncbi:MAG: hypothetical protein HY329_23005 [Chloroflexi bacterium]|nr:hypothetical protein [Chloroflexota bacterium]